MAQNGQKPGIIIETASRKKMKQYKTTVGVKDVSFGTKPELAMKQPQRDFSVQTDLITTTSLPQVSLMEKSQPNLTLEPTACSTHGTPQGKKKTHYR